MVPYVAPYIMPTILPVDGKARAVSPGEVIPYQVPDMYGRPWAQIWEEYHEKGMTKPKAVDLFDFDDKPAPAKR